MLCFDVLIDATDSHLSFLTAMRTQLLWGGERQRLIHTQRDPVERDSPKTWGKGVSFGPEGS